MSKSLQQLIFDAQIHCACAMPHLLRLRENLAQLKDPKHAPFFECADGLLGTARELADDLETLHEGGPKA